MLPLVCHWTGSAYHTTGDMPHFIPLLVASLLTILLRGLERERLSNCMRSSSVCSILVSHWTSACRLQRTHRQRSSGTGEGGGAGLRKVCHGGAIKSVGSGGTGLIHHYRTSRGWWVSSLGWKEECDWAEGRFGPSSADLLAAVRGWQQQEPTEAGPQPYLRIRRPACHACR